MDAKLFILVNKRTLREMCIMSVLYILKNHKAKKAKKLVYMEKFLTYQNSETPE